MWHVKLLLLFICQGAISQGGLCVKLDCCQLNMAIYKNEAETMFWPCPNQTAAANVRGAVKSAPPGAHLDCAEKIEMKRNVESG